MATRDDSITIEVDGSGIAGTLVMPETTLPGVLLVHGWGGSQVQYLSRARAIAALGCVSLTFDLRGHAGTSRQQETVSREDNLHDLLAAYDVLVSHPLVDSSKIAVIGSSYGGYLATILSTLRPVQWLALRAPALYRDQDWHLPKRQLHRDQNLEAYRQRLVPASENRALRACSAFRGDVLVVESEQDQVIPHPVIASYLEACAEPKSLTYRVIKNADHGLTEERHQQAYTSLLINWISEIVIGAGAAREPLPAAGAIEGELPEPPYLAD